MGKDGVNRNRFPFHQSDLRRQLDRFGRLSVTGLIDDLQTTLGVHGHQDAAATAIEVDGTTTPVLRHQISQFVGCHAYAVMRLPAIDHGQQQPPLARIQTDRRPRMAVTSRLRFDNSQAIERSMRLPNAAATNATLRCITFSGNGPQCPMDRTSMYSTRSFRLRIAATILSL